MLSRGASNISDAGESADLRRPPAPRSPEAWTPLRGEDNAGACRSTGSGPSEGAAVDSPRGADLRGVVSPGARHSRSARNSTSSKAPVSFGGLSAGGGLGGMTMGARRTSASELSMSHLSLVGSEAADADAIVTYGGGPPEPKPPHTPGILSLGPTTGIRFHGSQADAAPGDRGAAGAWDDPFVASRCIDQLLDALAMTGIARLDVLQRLTDKCEHIRTLPLTTTPGPHLAPPPLVPRPSRPAPHPSPHAFQYGRLRRAWRTKPCCDGNARVDLATSSPPNPPPARVGGTVVIIDMVLVRLFHSHPLQARHTCIQR